MCSTTRLCLCAQHVLHYQPVPESCFTFLAPSLLLQGCLRSGLKSLWECFTALPRIQPLQLNAGVESEALRINNYIRTPLLMLPQASWVFKTDLDDQRQSQSLGSMWLFHPSLLPLLVSGLAKLSRLALCLLGIWPRLALKLAILFHEVQGYEPTMCLVLLGFPTSFNFWHTILIKEAGLS